VDVEGDGVDGVDATPRAGLGEDLDAGPARRAWQMFELTLVADGAAGQALGKGGAGRGPGGVAVQLR
jgi:hypothetical protein